jgi:hypothetical protein
MSGLLLSVLPFALGAAVSPTLLTLELLILTGRTHRKSRAWMFVIGASATIFAFGLLAATLFRNAGDPSTTPNPWSIGIKGVAALLLLALGIRQLRPARTAGEKHHSRVADRMQNAKAPVFLGIGVVGMLANFSTLVLYLPAVHLIVHSGESSAERWAAGLMLWGITILPIVSPVLAVTIVGHRSDALLGRLNTWTTAHSRQINAGLCFLFAALLGYSGVKELLG